MFFLTDIDLAALLTMEDSVPKFLDSPNFLFFVIVNSLSLLRPFPSFSDIVPHIHLETNIHNDYEYGLYYRMLQYIWTVLLFQLRQ